MNTIRLTALEIKAHKLTATMSEEEIRELKDTKIKFINSNSSESRSQMFMNDTMNLISACQIALGMLAENN